VPKEFFATIGRAVSFVYQAVIADIVVTMSLNS